jgi:uncharacterized membrane protein YkoI
MGRHDRGRSSLARRYLMTRRSTFVTAAALGVAALVGGSVTIAAARDDDDGDEHDLPITGDELAQATEAALTHTGEGRVTETEVGDEDSYYEVEVTLDDGTEVDVQLDRAFQVVGSSPDGEDEAGDD